MCTLVDIWTKPDMPLLFTCFGGDQKCYIRWAIMPWFQGSGRGHWPNTAVAANGRKLFQRQCECNSWFLLTTFCRTALSRRAVANRIWCERTLMFLLVYVERNIIQKLFAFWGGVSKWKLSCLFKRTLRNNFVACSNIVKTKSHLAKSFGIWI